MRPADYEYRNGCHNCAHVAMIREWEEPPDYFCTLGDTKPRPKCGSTLMGESFFDEPNDQYELLDSEWDKWSRDRGVDPWNGCPHWRDQEDGNV